MVFVSWGAGWMWVTLFARILLTLAFSSLLFKLIQPSRSKIWLPAISFLFLILLTEVVLASPTGRDQTNFITPLFYTGIVRITTVYLAILGAFAVALSGKSWFAKPIPRTYLNLGLFFVLFAGAFTIEPIYLQDFTDLEQPVEKGLVKQAKRAGFSGNVPSYVFYLDTGCPHCYLLYHRLEASKDKISATVPIKLIFQGNQEQLDRFTSKTKIYYPYQLVQDKSFFTECGPQLPASFIVQNGTVQHYRIGDQFNYLQLSRICN